MGSQIVEKLEKNKNDMPSIFVAKIDTIVSKYNIEKVDFIKIDIEGAELQVLKSSENFIKKFKPKFIIEPHFIDGVLNKNQIVDFFTNIDYNTSIIEQGDFDYQPLIYAYSKN